jgi:hypothetical protein
VGLAYTLKGRYADAIPAAKRNLARYPKNFGGHVLLTIDYMELGRERQARAEVGEIRRINPGYSFEVAQRTASKWPDPEQQARFYADLYKAGQYRSKPSM